jgi:hypothetical protein
MSHYVDGWFVAIHQPDVLAPHPKNCDNCWMKCSAQLAQNMPFNHLAAHVVHKCFHRNLERREAAAREPLRKLITQHSPSLAFPEQLASAFSYYTSVKKEKDKEQKCLLPMVQWLSVK